MSASIVTQTADRWDIPNNQYFDLVGNEEALGQRNKSTYDAEIRTKATGRYNCHGLTFGSRRTCIDDPNSLTTILKHDGYVEVLISEILPGDIVLYFDVDGTVSHSGLVVEVPSTLPQFPRVVSKWGVNGGEYVHWAHRSPYGQNYRFYRISHSTESKILSQIILSK